MTMHATAGRAAGRPERIGLAVLALPTLLLSLDMSVLYLALPRLSADLNASSSQQLWISDIYGFMTAGFLVTMGTLGDRVGRRKLLLIGGTGFGAASVLAAYSPNAGLLILARALMGVAGATLMPSTLALISNMFQQPKQRATAIGIWLSCFMGGAALGPVVGGLLLTRFWWGSVFLLSVPVILLLLLAGPALLPEYRDADAGRLDPSSIALSLAAILPAVYAMKELAQNGLSVLPLIAIPFSIVCGWAFVVRQRGLASPLLDVGLFTSREFTGALLILMLAVATQGGVMLFVTLDFQLVQGFSPLRAGMWLLPPSIAMITGAMLAPVLAQRVRTGLVIASGTALACVGFLVLVPVDAGDGIALLVLGCVAIFFGVGAVGSLCNNLVAGTVPPEKAGSAASMAQTAGDFGMAFGVATLGSIGTVVYRTQLGQRLDGDLPTSALQAARENLATAITAAQRLPANTQGDLIASARASFDHGLTTVAAVSSVVALLLTALALRTLRHITPIGGADPSDADEPIPTGVPTKD